MAMRGLQAGAHKALDKISGALPKTLAALLEFLPDVKPVVAADVAEEPTRLQRVS
jgi:hypothetical protein